MKRFSQFISESCCDDCSSLDEELVIEDAVYVSEDGKKVKLNKDSERWN